MGPKQSNRIWSWQTHCKSSPRPRPSQSAKANTYLQSYQFVASSPHSAKRIGARRTNAVLPNATSTSCHSESSEQSKVLTLHSSSHTQIDAQERTIYPIFMTEPVSFRLTRNRETQRDNLRTRARKIRHAGYHLKPSHDGAFPMCASPTQLQNPHPDGAKGARHIENDREMSDIGRSPKLSH